MGPVLDLEAGDVGKVSNVLRDQDQIFRQRVSSNQTIVTGALERQRRIAKGGFVIEREYRNFLNKSAKLLDRRSLAVRRTIRDLGISDCGRNDIAVSAIGRARPNLFAAADRHADDDVAVEQIPQD